MGLQLRMVLIGLLPVAALGLGWLLALPVGTLVALAALGAALGAWLCHQVVIAPMQAAHRRLLQQHIPQQQQLDLLREVLDKAPTAIAIKDSAGHYLFSNAEHARQCARTPLEMLGKTDAEVTPPDAARTFQASDLQVLRSGQSQTERTVLQTQDGQWRHMETVKYPLQGPDGQTLALGFVATDITDWVVPQEKFSRVFHASPDWIIISRLSDGAIEEVNEAFERATGYCRQEVIGRTVLALGLCRDPAQHQALAAALQDCTALKNTPVQMHDRQGRLREMRLNASHYEAHGERFMISLLHDVTDALQAENALRDSETRFSRLFELSPLPMAFAFDSDDFSTFHRNDAWHTTFGLSRAASAGQSAAQLGLWVNADDAAQFHRMLAERRNINHWNVQWNGAHGARLWISIFGRFITEPSRTTLVLTFLDITHQQQAQQEVLSLNAELEARVAERTRQLQNANTDLSDTLHTLNQTQDFLVQSEKLAGLGALVAGVAHELNTPIGNSLTVASTMEHKTREFTSAMAGGLRRSTLEQFVTDTRFATDILVRNLTRAATMLTSFKQVAVDQTSSHRRAFVLQEVVEEIVLTLNPAIRKSGCQVLTQIDPDLRFDSYPGPLGQVLSNLINNAMVHAFAPEQPGTITVRATALDPQTVEIVVSDNGQGIAPAHIKRIFDPFFTTRLGMGGSGLGLHIVHNIVTGVLGGKVEVHSPPGAGASFVLHLPCQAPALEPQD